MYVQIPGSKYPLRKCLATWFSLYVYVFNIPRKKNTERNKPMIVVSFWVYNGDIIYKPDIKSESQKNI